MDIGDSITRKADRMNEEHAQRVIFELDYDSPESLARTGGMGFTLDILKRINGIEANWYSFQGVRDRAIFIVLYPLSVSFCYFVNDMKNVFDFTMGKRGE